MRRRRRDIEGSLKKLVEGLKLNLKKLRAIIEDVIKLGKEAYGMRDFHCYDYEPVKKRCSAEPTPAADMNSDGDVNILDLTILINLIVGF